MKLRLREFKDISSLLAELWQICSLVHTSVLLKGILGIYLDMKRLIDTNDVSILFVTITVNINAIIIAVAYHSCNQDGVFRISEVPNRAPCFSLPRFGSHPPYGRV